MSVDPEHIEYLMNIIHKQYEEFRNVWSVGDVAYMCRLAYITTMMQQAIEDPLDDPDDNSALLAAMREVQEALFEKMYSIS